ncbi:hypothetical protein R1flu_025905 [Riccia fluitans]|uniref:HhH-GPD domain-containing protein n=1 Tax=Riccia fluitans TaxID=41844 RepID=A0ABD1XZ26_9MARC
MLGALALARGVVATHGRTIWAPNSSCLTQVSRTQYSWIAKMLPERRSRRVGARASVVADKKFSTPLKHSTLTKAEIKRASAIFSDAEDHYSSSELSGNSSEDCASEKFERRRRDPQLDTVRRKLSFGPKSRSTSKKSNEVEVKTLCTTYRARKVRGAEQKPVSVDEMVKPEPVDNAVECDRMKLEVGADISVGPQTRNSKRLRSNLEGSCGKVSELVEDSVKQESLDEVKDVEDLRPRRRKNVKPLQSNVKSEEEQFAELVKEKAHTSRVLQRRKLDQSAKGASTEELNKSRRQPRKELDQFISTTSTDLILADASKTINSGTGRNLSLEKASVALSISAPYIGPYPSHVRPYPEECEAARDLLSALHGHLPEYERHKKSCPTMEPSNLLLEAADDRGDGDATCATVSSASELAVIVRVAKVKDEVAVPAEYPRVRRSVLDSLVGTLLSQNTTDTNSRRAFASLKSKYPTWEEVYKADPKDVEECIRCGGLAETKASRILGILKTLAEERGKLCMEYLRHMSNEEIKSELSRFKGVGPKTVACVLMFHLQREEFPVDTHVFRISKALGWVPANADREKTYLHLNQRIPDHLKFDIHCLFVTHGKKCPNCAKRRMKKSRVVDCPLVNWSARVLKSRCNPSVLLLKGSEES